MRIYNARLGKFLSVDPLTASYPWYTPYQFAGNIPTSCVDVDGLEPAWYGSAGEDAQAKDLSTGENASWLWNSDCGEWTKCMDPVTVKPTAHPYWQQAGVSESEFLFQVGQRASGMSKFYQGSTGYCGMAALVHFWAQDNPDAYRNVMMGLYYNGSTQFGNIQLTIPGECVSPTGTVQSRSMPAADFVLFTSLRWSTQVGYAEHELMDFYSPWSLTSIMENGCGYNEIYNCINPSQPSTAVPNIQLVNAMYNSGYNVILAVNTRMVGGSSYSPFSNHYVGFHGATALGDGNVAVSLWTWGYTKTYTMSQSEFNNNYFGAIIFK